MSTSSRSPIKPQVTTITSVVRHILHTVAKRSSHHPIEMIVTCLVFASFSYFYLFHLAKSQSTLFTDPVATVKYDPAIIMALPGQDQFLSHDITKLSKPPHNAVRVNLKQISISSPITSEDPTGVLSLPILRSVLNLQKVIENEVAIPIEGSSTKHSFKKDLCYKLPETKQCFSQSPLHLWNDDMAMLNADSDIITTITQNLDTTSFLFNNLQYNVSSDLKIVKASAEELVLSYAFDANGPYRNHPANSWEHKVSHVHVDGVVSQNFSNGNGKKTTIGLIITLVRNIYFRINELIDNANNVDVFVIVSGYVMMIATFISLYLNMRKLGSRSILATAVLGSGFFAFLCAILTVHVLGQIINPVLLSEAIPFLVITIGFDRHCKLTRAVLQDNLDETKIHDGVVTAVESVGMNIVRDVAIEMLVLGLGAMSGVNGLKEFCFLSVFLIFYDMLFLITFYTAILTLKLELRRIRALNSSGEKIVGSDKSENPIRQIALTAFEPKAATLEKEANLEHPLVAKFKLAMIVVVILLHSFKLTTTLQSTSSVKTIAHNAPRVNTVAKTVSPVLSLLLAQHKNSARANLPLIVEVSQPIAFHTATSGQLVPGFISGAFETLWAIYGSYLQDPVISKWIILGLSLSVGLNIYLFNVAKSPKTHVNNNSEKTRAPRRATLVEGSKPSPKPVEEKQVEVLNIAPVVVGPPALPKNEIVYPVSSNVRPIDDCVAILKNPKAGGPAGLTDEEVLLLAIKGKISAYALEKVLGDFERAVRIRRAMISRSSLTKTLETSLLPLENYDYGKVMGACCENVIGYMPIPVGVAGPMNIDGENIHIPMATTEGCLVASAARGCKAINAGGGARTVVTADGMTRGPCVEFPNILRAAEAKRWLEEDGFSVITEAFNSTSRFARLRKLKIALAGKMVFIRFSTTTGDAMGMNMISKGCEKSLAVLSEKFPDMQIISLSGNYCTDKKAAAINWIEGRGKSVVSEAVIPGDVVESVLKTTVSALVELNTSKNLIGSAMAGSIGGFNAHAANILTAVYLATGQDPAQNVESSNCITLMKAINDGRDLHISCTMPSIEVGTVGGGTILAPQASMLDFIGVRGPHPTEPGNNARRLARVICAAVMAGELSLCAALAAGHLVKSHMQHNRAQPATTTAQPAPTAAPISKESSPAVPPAPTSSVTVAEPIPGTCIKS